MHIYTICHSFKEKKTKEKKRKERKRNLGFYFLKRGDWGNMASLGLHLYRIYIMRGRHSIIE